MFILAVDDEQNMLDKLLNELVEVFPQVNIHGETKALAAVEWVKSMKESNNVLEYAFLDIHMRGMNGLELTKHIKTISPRHKIHFLYSLLRVCF